MLTLERATAVEEVRELIVEYASATGVDLEFQGFSQEMETLESYYELLLIARWNGELAGCVALRRIDERLCEMKRLYVRQSFRGHRIGLTLAERVIDEARDRGYEAMRLDTLPTMADAMRMYEQLGFKDIEPYRYNPIEGSRFLELRLSPSE
jgi:ribosomal protein S18 acetylase RimI-like enzyme